MTTGVSVGYKLLGFLRALFRNCTKIKHNAGDIHSACVHSTCLGCALRVCAMVLHYYSMLHENLVGINVCLFYYQSQIWSSQLLRYIFPKKWLSRP